MRRSRLWVDTWGPLVLFIAGVPAMAHAEQISDQAFEVAEPGMYQDPLEGVSWSVINDPDLSDELQGQMVIGQHRSADLQDEPSQDWLDLHGGRSRTANRKPDLWRYEF